MKKTLICFLACLPLLFACNKKKEDRFGSESPGLWVPAISEKDAIGLISIAGDSLTYIPKDGMRGYSGKIKQDETDDELKRADFAANSSIILSLKGDTLFVKNEVRNDKSYIPYLRFEPGNTISEIPGKDLDFLYGKTLITESEQLTEYLFSDSSARPAFPNSVIIDKKNETLFMDKSMISSFFTLNKMPLMQYVRQTKGLPNQSNETSNQFYLVINISPDTLSVVPVKAGQQKAIHYTVVKPFIEPFKFDGKFLSQNSISIDNSIEHPSLLKIHLRKGSFRGTGQNKTVGNWFLTPDKKSLVLFDPTPLNGQLFVYRIFKIIQIEEKSIVAK